MSNDMLFFLIQSSEYLVGFLAIRVGFPHQHSEAPHVTSGGEFEVVDALGSVPLDRPLPVTFGLKKQSWHY